MSAIAAREGDSVDGRIIPECIQKNSALLDPELVTRRR
jgi:hypothetical protein